MSNAPPSTAKPRTHATGAGLGPGVVAPGVGSAAATVGGGAREGIAAGARRTRRPPLRVLVLAGAAAAIGYGHFVLGMRLGPPLVMVGLGGLTLALCAAALWRVIDPLTRAEIALVPEARAPHRLRELEREKQAVLKAIKEIELDYQMRKISQVDYREMVERYRARALRVMGDLAAGEDYRALIERELRDRLAARTVAASGPPPIASAAATTAANDPDPLPTSAPSPSPAPHPPVAADAHCPACAAMNDVDALFCKKCGKKLTSASNTV